MIEADNRSVFHYTYESTCVLYDHVVKSNDDPKILCSNDGAVVDNASWLDVP